MAVDLRPLVLFLASLTSSILSDRPQPAPSSILGSHHSLMTRIRYEANLDWMAHLKGLGIAFQRLIVRDVPHSINQVYDAVGREVMSFPERCFASGP